MAEPHRLRVLTWNLQGLESTRLDTRMEALSSDLVLGVPLREALAGAPPRPMPNVLCLQEVVRRAHTSKLRPHLGAAGFVLFPEKPPPEVEEYSLIAVRPPWRIVDAVSTPFSESPLARRYLEARIERADGARVRVLTAHMESLRSGGDARVAQVEELDARLHQDDTPGLFAGDTNLRDREWKSAVSAGVKLVDAFDLAGAPAEHRHTWWPEESERGFRFDRVWLSSTTDWRVRELRTRRRPTLSDHAGLEVELGW